MRRGRWPAGRRWVLEAPRLEPWEGGARVVAEGTHGRIAFACADAPLEPAPEAFAGLLLLPALRRGAVIRVEAPVDRAWLEGAERIAATWRAWWGGGRRFPLRAATVTDTAPPRAPGRGLCFTGGVESFYALLGWPDRFDHLVFVHGYDIPLADRPRMDAFRPSLEAVARATGTRAVVIETDLRENPVFASASWERTHGAGLAAAGHLLAGRLGRLTFGPSWMWGDLRPWGTHPLVDAHWSSSRLATEPGDPSLNRSARVARIARDPLVHRHLRVCWENLAPTGNCGRCEKCVRTMIALAGLGVLARCETFGAADELPARVDALPALPAGYDRVYADMLGLDLDPPLRAALDRLIARSRGPGRGGGG